MTTALVIIGSLILVALLLLIMPIRLYINTDTHQYYAGIPGLMRIRIMEHEEEILLIRFRVLFFSFNFYPFRPNKKKNIRKIDSETKEGRTLKKKKRRGPSFRQFMAIMRSFQIKRFEWDLDTGDVIYNSYLVPVFVYLNYRNHHVGLNYEGYNRLILHIENRPIRVLWAFINN